MNREKNKDKDNYIDSLKESEKQLKFLLKLSDKVRPLADATCIHKLITSETRKYFESDRCYYGEIDGNKMIVRQDARDKRKKSIVGEYDWGKYLKSKAIIDLGNPIVVEDIYLRGPADMGLRERFIQMELMSYIIIPVIKDSNTVGALCITQSDPRKWTSMEVKLAIDIAERTWMAVERAKAENEKEQFLSQTIEEREKVKAIIESIDADVWITDTLGNTTLIDSIQSKKIGIQAHEEPISEVLKQVEIFRIDGTPLKEKDEITAKALQGETTKVENLVIYKKSGMKMYKESVASPILDRNGDIIGAVTISTDITKRIHMEQALRDKEIQAMELIKKLEKTDELRIAFLSSLSHELRNPLATITMGLDLMDYIEDNKEERQKLKETLKRQAKQLSRLVDDLLNMTRITRNKFELKLEKLELNQLIVQVIEDSNLFFNEKGIKVETKIMQERIYIKGDGARLTQVIENLLHNASKFTPKGGKVTILLKRAQTTNEAIISIKDTGVGMPMELIKVIFEPYVQAKNNLGKSLGGLGMGLFIAKDVVERHKGQMKVLSEGEGKGAEFVISLPTL